MAEVLFPTIDKTPDDYERMYPARELDEGAKVTRFAPSPTVFLHFGSLFAAFIAAKTAGDMQSVLKDNILGRKIGQKL